MSAVNGNGDANKSGAAAENQSVCSQNSDCLADIIFTVDFAAQKHKNQRRKDPEKTPYINHPIGKRALIVVFL